MLNTKFLFYTFLVVSSANINMAYAAKCSASGVTVNELGGCSVGISYSVRNNSSGQVIAQWVSCSECHSGATLKYAGSINLDDCDSFSGDVPSTAKYSCVSGGGSSSGSETSKCGYKEDYYCDDDGTEKPCPITDDIKDWVDTDGYPIGLGCCPRGVYNDDGETSIYSCRISDELSYCDDVGCFELTDECYYSD